METSSNNTASNSSLSEDSSGLDIWRFIHSKLQEKLQVILLWVLESDGSSPGRRGFKMAVCEDGELNGTIGGGIMEHKLVEKAKSLFIEKQSKIILQRQFHDKEHNKNQSGMICSGSQLIAFVPFTDSDLSVIYNIVEEPDNEKIIHLSKNGISIRKRHEDEKPGFEYKNEEEWQYKELVDQRPVIHIIGGGHVGLALSELMNFLGFYIKIYDNRPQLNTMEQNNVAHEKHIVDYESINEVIEANEEEYVAIMTFGYRDDKIVFKQLLDKKFYYIGLMGSDSKIKTLYKELEEEGISPVKWQHCHSPIGINILSKTTKEIAVSIAAEIIKEKNKNLPTGRRER